ncbi:hypothetical protein OAN10_03990, partial [Alphaproteobacteria bacterium]|nr:hypothetical protein [Alphaproteobacteria bacterium]
NYKNNLLFNLPKEIEELEKEIISSKLNKDIVEELIVTLKDIVFHLPNTVEIDELIDNIDFKISAKIESLNKEIDSLKIRNAILLITLIIIVIGINGLIVFFIIRKSKRQDNEHDKNLKLL